jgi:hypothetical protein
MGPTFQGLLGLPGRVRMQTVLATLQKLPNPNVSETLAYITRIEHCRIIVPAA